MCRARRGGPRTPSGPTDANLDCAFVENTLVFVVPKIGRALGPSFTTPLHRLYYQAGQFFTTTYSMATHLVLAF